MSSMPRLGALNQTVPASTTVALADKARRLKAEGRRVFDFTAGEPDFAPPDAVLRAAHRAIDDGYHKYTAPDGIPLLKDAIANWHEQTYGIRPDHAQIVVTSGAKQAIAEALLVALSQGDEVIIPAPYWVSYPAMVRIAGARPVVVDTRKGNGFKLDPEAVFDSVTDHTRAIILNSPNNPSGAVFDEAAVREIAEFALERGIWLIADDIYCKLVYDDATWWSPAMEPKYAEITVAINGVSKTYAMTGWRIGWLVAPKQLARAVTRLQSQLTSNATAVAQVAAAAALTEPSAQEAAEQMRIRFQARRDLMVEALSEVSGIDCPRPNAAFYAFTDARALISRIGCGSDFELCERLIESAGVVAVPGSAFGAQGWLRFSFATDEQTIQEGMEALRRFAEQASSKE